MSNEVLDDAEKLLEIIGKIRELSGGCFFLKIVSVLTMISCVLCLIMQNSFVSAMLGSMSETIKSLSFLTFLLSVISLPSILLLNWLESIYLRKKAELDRRHEEEAARLKNEALLQDLSRLGTGEKVVLKYIVERCEGSAWLPAGDKRVIKLYKRGMLEPLYQGSALYRSNEQCFLFSVPDEPMRLMR